VIEVDLSGSEGTVSGAPYGALQELPDTHWPSGPVLRFRASTSNLRHLRATLGPDVRWIDPHGRLAEIAAADAFEAAGHRKPDDTDRAYLFKTPPIGRQLEAFAFARHMTAFALFCDPGTGKTWCALNIAAAKFEAGEIDAVAVIAPNGVHRQWIEEQVPLHLPDVPRWSATFTDTKRGLAAMMAPRPDVLRIVAVNVEAFARGKTAKLIERFMGTGRCMLIIDESTRIKNPRAKRTRAILKLRDLAAVRAILTGTPITRGIEDLYAPLSFLHPGIAGFSTFNKFRDRYCILAPAFRGAAFGVVKVTGHRNIDELTRRIAPYCFRMTKEGLPEKTYENRYIELSADQRRHYNELVALLRTELEGGSLTAVNAAVRTVRLQQVLSGYLPHNDDESSPGDMTHIEQNRTAALIEVLDDSPQAQAVVWVRFQHDADVVSAALRLAGIPCVVCDGRTPVAQRETNKQAFVSGMARVYVGNPAAVGTGTDGLQVAALTINYSHTFNAEHTWQAEDRTHRQGMNPDGGHYVSFIARSTVDELLLSNTADKRTLAARIIDNPALLTEA
jgi:superfamily II DNA or RNA helicase